MKIMKQSKETNKQTENLRNKLAKSKIKKYIQIAAMVSNIHNSTFYKIAVKLGKNAKTFINN